MIPETIKCSGGCGCDIAVIEHACSMFYIGAMLVPMCNEACGKGMCGPYPNPAIVSSELREAMVLLTEAALRKPDA